jgi:hypothetical protein
MRLPICFFFLFAAVIASAQVQVSQEPRHHKVLDNEWVRVLDVHIRPHDTTMMHKHSTPSVFLVLSNTKTGSQVLVEPGKTSFADGNIWFESFKDTPRIHRVWNEDNIEFHVMDIELPHAPEGNFFVMDPPFGKRLFDTENVRVYRVSLPHGQHQVFPRSAKPVLVVNLSGPGADGTVNKQAATGKGDYFFLPASSGLVIVNNSATAEQQFALIYLK